VPGLRWNDSLCGGTGTGGSVFRATLTLVRRWPLQSMAATAMSVGVRRYASAAVGAYQFLACTWRAGTRALGLSGLDLPARIRPPSDLVERRGPPWQRFDLACFAIAPLTKLSRRNGSFRWLRSQRLGQPAKNRSLAAFSQRMLGTGAVMGWRLGLAIHHPAGTSCRHQVGWDAQPFDSLRTLRCSDLLPV